MASTHYEPDQETSFKMPTIPRAKVSPNLVKKSEQLNKIFQMKNSLEKTYGDSIKNKNPIKQIDSVYDKLFKRQMEEVREQARQRQMEENRRKAYSSIVIAEASDNNDDAQ